MAGMTFSGHNSSQQYSWGRIFSGIVVLSGLWQIVAPYILDFSTEQAALWNAVICGVLLVVFAGVPLFGTQRWSQTVIRACCWLASLTGLWLLVSPFVLKYQAVVPAFWSAIVVGLLSLILAGIAAIWQRANSTVNA